jgi:hypothetical protein
MDDLNGVNELANKYPEARPMINRKKRKLTKRKNSTGRAWQHSTD